jgi:hypothetical protein
MSARRDGDIYPPEIVCPNDPEHIAEDIGDDTRGRHYYFCALCGREWLLAFDAPELKNTPPQEPAETPAVSTDAEENWKNDAIQFPRLLAELRAVGLYPAQYQELIDAMSLSEGEIDALLERAEAAWQRIKERT